MELPPIDEGTVGEALMQRREFLSLIPHTVLASVVPPIRANYPLGDTPENQGKQVLMLVDTIREHSELLIHAIEYACLGGTSPLVVEKDLKGVIALLALLDAPQEVIQDAARRLEFIQMVEPYMSEYGDVLGYVWEGLTRSYPNSRWVFNPGVVVDPDFAKRRAQQVKQLDQFYNLPIWPKLLGRFGCSM